jgi:ABC-type branched-subunit amino acid transport system ATPase component
VTSTPILELDDLVVGYGRAVTAVRGVSMQVGAGEIMGILGPNGAGKTSLLRGIGGLLPLEPAKVVSGRMSFEGHRLKLGLTPSHMARLGVMLVPERLKVFSALTVGEHFKLTKASRDEVGQFSDRFPWLGGLLQHSAGDLSGGQRQLLGLLCALVRRPKLLLVDEFSLGLAPTAISEVADAIRWARQETGASVLIVEQNVEVAVGMCDRISLMSGGALTWTGDPHEAEQRVVTGAYFE